MSCIREFVTMDDILFAGYLFWVSIQDIKEMKVARYTHILGVVAIVCTTVSNYSRNGAIYSVHLLYEVTLVFIFQAVGYYFKTYGLADVITICICTLFYCFQNGGRYCLQFYFVLYAVSGMLLVITQLRKGNIRGSALNQPVPYIPYISVAFFLTKWVI